MFKTLNLKTIRDEISKEIYRIQKYPKSITYELFNSEDTCDIGKCIFPDYTDSLDKYVNKIHITLDNDFFIRDLEEHAIQSRDMEDFILSYVNEEYKYLGCYIYILLHEFGHMYARYLVKDNIKDYLECMDLIDSAINLSVAHYDGDLYSYLTNHQYIEEVFADTYAQRYFTRIYKHLLVKGLVPKLKEVSGLKINTTEDLQLINKVLKLDDLNNGRVWCLNMLLNQEVVLDTKIMDDFIEYNTYQAEDIEDARKIYSMLYKISNANSNKVKVEEISNVTNIIFSLYKDKLNNSLIDWNTLYRTRTTTRCFRRLMNLFKVSDSRGCDNVTPATRNVKALTHF